MRDEELIEFLHTPFAVQLRDAFGEFLVHYFRLKVRGLANLPKTGPVLVVPNHSGFAGFDVIVLAHLLRRKAKRSPKIVAHRAFFDLFQSLRLVAEQAGLTHPKFFDVEAELMRNELVLLFPEAEAGNFKSSLRRYRLRRFHAGFVRLALRTGAPIVPCLVIGAEESNFNLGSIDLSWFIRHLVLPLPINVLPLPAKWTIEFLPPLDLGSYPPGRADDHEFVHALCDEVQTTMQAAIDDRLRRRQGIYF